MEGICFLDTNLLVSELTVGQELTRQLENCLDGLCQVELKALVQSILTSWERCKSIALTNALQQQDSHVHVAGSSPIARINSLVSVNDFPSSGVSEHDGQDTSKKRKIMHRRTSHVQVTGADGPPDDGYTWRKYGQKDILRANHPRGYYRCRHRHSHGCMATKQVQRSDGDSTVFDITYQGEHTCHQRLQQPIQMPLSRGQQDPPQENMINSLIRNNFDSQMHANFRNSLTVKTDNLGSQEPESMPFAFHSTSTSQEQAENYGFSHSSTPDSYNFNGSFNSFISPGSSESNFFSLSPIQMSSFDGTTHSELAEIVSAANSTPSSPFSSFDFTLGITSLDQSFLDNDYLP